MPPCRSKLLVMTWLCEAARNLRSVQFAAICPGAIASNIARNTPYLAGLVTFFMKIFFPSPYKAAAPVVWMALADKDEFYVKNADSEPYLKMLATSIRQPIYYQHLWQRVRAVPRSLLFVPSHVLSRRRIPRIMQRIWKGGSACMPT
jgi:hypothetical protein